MYRIRKVLNHNSIIAVQPEEQKEYLILGKGVGFGRKIAERIDTRPEDTVYSLTQDSERGSAMEIVKNVSPEFLEIASAILDEAEKTFGKIDRNIVFPMADHLEFAVRRVQNQEEILNPLQADIQVLFYAEYKVAESAIPLLQERFNISISPDEIGYIALHVHAALTDQKVSQALQTAQLVRTCIALIEEKTGAKIKVLSLDYNRLMNHIRYMVTRIVRDEPLKMSLNEYMETRYPTSYEIAHTICDEMSHQMHKPYHDAEIGYLAMHIERVIESSNEGSDSI